MTAFGYRFKSLRNEKDISQEELGRIFGVSGGTVSFWESGKRFPLEDTLVLIANYFDVSLDWLLGRTNVREWNNTKK